MNAEKTFKNTQWRQVTCLFFLFNNEHGKYQPCNKENKHRIITINTTSSIQLVRRIEHFDLKNVSVRKKVHSDHPNNENNISLDHLLQRGLFYYKSSPSSGWIHIPSCVYNLAFGLGGMFYYFFSSRCLWDSSKFPLKDPKGDRSQSYHLVCREMVHITKAKFTCFTSQVLYGMWTSWSFLGRKFPQRTVHSVLRTPVISKYELIPWKRKGKLILRQLIHVITRQIKWEKYMKYCSSIQLYGELHFITNPSLLSSVSSIPTRGGVGGLH